MYKVDMCRLRDLDKIELQRNAIKVSGDITKLVLLVVCHGGIDGRILLLDSVTRTVKFKIVNDRIMNHHNPSLFIALV